jgi:hypothetical protein
MVRRYVIKQKKFDHTWIHQIFVTYMLHDIIWYTFYFMLPNLGVHSPDVIITRPGLRIALMLGLRKDATWNVILTHTISFSQRAHYKLQKGFSMVICGFLRIFVLFWFFFAIFLSFLGVFVGFLLVTLTVIVKSARFSLMTAKFH